LARAAFFSARSSRLLRLLARSFFEARASRFEARSFFDERASRADSRRRSARLLFAATAFCLPESFFATVFFEFLAGALAAGFFVGFFEGAACALKAAEKSMKAETTNAERPGDGNFRVMKLILA
jgi:hypothetical protein